MITQIPIRVVSEKPIPVTVVTSIAWWKANVRPVEDEDKFTIIPIILAEDQHVR